MTTITVPVVAAHLLVSRRGPCACEGRRYIVNTQDGGYAEPCICTSRVLRFLPTDTTTDCETCGGRGTQPIPPEAMGSICIPAACPDCTAGRRPLRAGDRISIRADDTLPEHGARFGGWRYSDASSWPWLFNGRTADNGKPESIPLRPGEVVGHATVARVLLIVWDHENDSRDAHPRIVVKQHEQGAVAIIGGEYADISDHLDAGLTFTPGSVALDLNVETTG